MVTKGASSENVLVAKVLKGLPENIGNSLPINTGEGLSWDFMYKSCAGIETSMASSVFVRTRRGKGSIRLVTRIIRSRKG